MNASKPRIAAADLNGTPVLPDDYNSVLAEMKSVIADFAQRRRSPFASRTTSVSIGCTLSMTDEENRKKKQQPRRKLIHGQVRPDLSAPSRSRRP
jgi:hypothetical protein